jgi:Glycosyl transferase family 2
MEPEPPATPIAEPVRVPAPLEPIARAVRRPTFGVIIAVYQGATTIGEAVDSVLAQTLPADEIVICDDGSTDDLEGALAPYGDRLVLIRKENGGAASALNVAARAARSDYVVLLDADDAFAPERIEAIASLAVARPDLDVIATDAVMELNGEPVATYREQHGFELHNQRAEILRSCFFGWPAIRRSRLLALGGFDESLRITWDWDCYIRLILSGSAVGLVDRPLYRWRFGHLSLSSDPARNSRENAKMMEKLLEGDLLAPEERSIAAEEMEGHDQGAEIIEAQDALVRRNEGARRLVLSIAKGRRFPLSTRVKAALAALAPGLAGRFLARTTSTNADRPGVAPSESSPPVGSIDVADP